MNPSQLTGSIMVVDDDPPSLRLLESALRDRGFHVRSFPLGRLALAAASRQAPDLILLDVNMPELTGYETCERLKQDAALASVPVIFLTGHDDVADKVRAFRCGGVDHIGKPVQIEEVYARVQTHLQIRSLQLALEQHNRFLEDTVRERTRELREAHERLTVLDDAKNQFLRIISHELRTPLHGLLGASEIALCELPDSAAANEVHSLYQRSRHRILSLVDDALLLAQIDIDHVDRKASAVALNTVLTRAIESARPFAHSRKVPIEPPPPQPGSIAGEEDLLVRAINALLETAIKFCEPRQPLRIGIGAPEGEIHLSIDAHGRSLPPNVIDRFFDVLSIGTAVTPGGDLGLSPALASRILSLFGGSVAISNHALNNVRLSVVLRRPPGSYRAERT